MADAIASRGHNVAIPFRVGWGFQLDQKALSEVADILSQSLSGWGGVFNAVPKASYRLPYWTVAIPFRVGWGFQPIKGRVKEYNGELSQSLSGWGFQPQQWGALKLERKKSQSLSGWGGVFNAVAVRISDLLALSRNPFQGGVGFSTLVDVGGKVQGNLVAIPFRVGWGFQHIGSRTVKAKNFTTSQSLSGWDGVFNFRSYKRYPELLKSQSLSGWDGVFNTTLSNSSTSISESRNPFQGGVGFSTYITNSEAAADVIGRNPFQGGVGFSTPTENRERKFFYPVAIPFRVGWGFQPHSSP